MLGKREFIPCDKCKSAQNPGYFTDKNGEIFECDCLKKYNNQIRLNKYLETIGIPFKYINYNLSQYKGTKSLDTIKNIKKLIKKMDTFIKEGMQLYFFGDEYTQKTSVACYFLKRAVVRKFSGTYITFSQLVHLIRKVSFSKAEEFFDLNSKLTLMKGVDLLVIDDSFDQEKIYIGKSQFIKTLIYDFFQYRALSMKAHIFIAKEKRVDIKYTIFGTFFEKFFERECLDLEFKDIIPEDDQKKKILELINQTKN